MKFIYYIKKWTKMVFRKSVLHVNQDIGKIFSVSEIKGYFNNLTEKVTMEKEDLLLPTNTWADGYEGYFPIQIFQYGLGAYDLYLLKNEDKYLEKFKNCVQWAENNIEENGSILNFIHEYPDSPYSAMAQGEFASLMVRAYAQFGEIKYLDLAKKSLDFMLIPLEDGGTSQYIDEDLILYEFTCHPYVFNGWIFAMMGIYDYYLSTKDENYKQIFDRTFKTLEKNIEKMDLKYWSRYDSQKIIASPFYNKLHIAQLTALVQIYDSIAIKKMLKKFIKYKNSFIKRNYAFMRKAFQKIFAVIKE